MQSTPKQKDGDCELLPLITGNKDILYQDSAIHTQTQGLGLWVTALNNGIKDILYQDSAVNTQTEGWGLDCELPPLITGIKDIFTKTVQSTPKHQLTSIV